MPKPVVAIVGRPNVGKSTLFNRLAGERISIVEDTPGVTRDRIYADASWLNHEFTLVDTGGLEPDSDEILFRQMFRQAELAMETADVILFVVDVKTGATDADIEIANILRKQHKPVLLIVNKVDVMTRENLDVYEFYTLGLGDPISVSAGQALGLGDMLDEVVARFPANNGNEDDEDCIKVAVVGKPNSGKSSLINRILGEERVIVSDMPGTTRDAIDTYIEREGQRYMFIDTAGIRRKSKIRENIERYSIVRAVAAVERADVCILLIDAMENISDQDTKIAGIAHERGKAAIVAVNKWDLVEKDSHTMKKFMVDLETELAYMPYAPKMFISATTGQRVHKLYDTIKTVSENSALRISTGVLNEVIAEATSITQPPTDRGRALRIYYATQVSVKPPTFILFVNDSKLMHYSYRRYIENQIRAAFGFVGTPIHFIIRNKE
ncbi:MAG: ribosome biogenesis GTPase Der [Defluviitaleaceae bacterium]|nr:ribosome biogenesis GTPase Der [Defluviitaleaceae bacterium]